VLGGRVSGCVLANNTVIAPEPNGYNYFFCSFCSNRIEFLNLFFDSLMHVIDLEASSRISTASTT